MRLRTNAFKGALAKGVLAGTARLKRASPDRKASGTRAGNSAPCGKIQSVRGGAPGSAPRSSRAA